MRICDATAGGSFLGGFLLHRDTLPRRRPSFLRPAGVLLAALLGSVGSAAGQSLDLDVHKLAIAGGEVEFHQTFSETAPGADRSSASLSCGKAGAATVCVDQALIEPNEFRQFDYDFFVFQPSSSPVRFKFLATPTGKFVDHIDTLHFDLNVAGVLVPGILLAPIYCNEQVDLLSVAAQKVQQVGLIGDTPVRLHLQSLAQNLDILVGDPVTVSCNHSSWAKCDAQFLNLRDLGRGLKALPITASQPALEVRLTPIPLRALSISLLPFKSSDEDAETGVHDRIEVAIHYRSRGGLERLATCEFPIRFTPSVLSLLATVSGGAVFGSLIPIVFGRRRRSAWLKAAGLAIAAGLLLEMGAIGLRTAVSIYGFQIDPHQILPTFVLGAIVGLLGIDNLKLIIRQLKKVPAVGGAQG